MLQKTCCSIRYSATLFFFYEKIRTSRPTALSLCHFACTLAIHCHLSYVTCQSSFIIITLVCNHCCNVTCHMSQCQLSFIIIALVCNHCCNVTCHMSHVSWASLSSLSSAITPAMFHFTNPSHHNFSRCSHRTLWVFYVFIFLIVFFAQLAKLIV